MKVPFVLSALACAACGCSSTTTPIGSGDAQLDAGASDADSGAIGDASGASSVDAAVHDGGDADADEHAAPTTLKGATGPGFGLDRVGAATSIGLIEGEAVYAETLAREFNYVTPENDFKWEPIEPEPGKWNWAPADGLVAWARANGMSIKGHNLVWYSQLPTWVTELTDAGQVRQALVDHITTEVTHFKGQVVAWDVVNEAVLDDGSGFRSNVFFNALGADYIELAFRTAHVADPDALLIYNDYGGEGGGAKSDAIFNLLKDLLAKGVPVGGVGLQMHIDAAGPPNPQSVRVNVQRLGALGLRVNISEMDVVAGNVRGPLDQKLSVQGDVYHDIVSACVVEPACDAVTFWGFTDAHTWIDELVGPNNHPLLFDESYAKKPAYDGVLDAMTGR